MQLEFTFSLFVHCATVFNSIKSDFLLNFTIFINIINCFVDYDATARVNGIFATSSGKPQCHLHKNNAWATRKMHEKGQRPRIICYVEEHESILRLRVKKHHPLPLPSSTHKAYHAPIHPLMILSKRQDVTKKGAGDLRGKGAGDLSCD